MYHTYCLYYCNRCAKGIQESLRESLDLKNKVYSCDIMSLDACDHESDNKTVLVFSKIIFSPQYAMESIRLTNDSRRELLRKLLN